MLWVLHKGPAAVAQFTTSLIHRSTTTLSLKVTIEKLFILAVYHSTLELKLNNEFELRAQTGLI